MEYAGQSSKKKKRNITEVQSEYVEPEDGYGCPFVGYFPSGYNPLRDGEESSNLEVSSYHNTTKFKTKQVQLVARPKEASVDFVGTNYSGEGALWQPCNYALGVFDKNSRTLKVLPVSGGKIFRMEARVRGMAYGIAEGEEENAEELTVEERRKKHQLLTASFGSHKSKLAAKRFDKSKLKEEALGDQTGIGRLLEAAAVNTVSLTSKEALAQANANIFRNIPPYDISATKPEEVYLLDNIILREEWDQQSDVDELMMAAKYVQKAADFQKRNDYPIFVRNRIHKLRSGHDEGRDKLAHVFSYITYLLKFKDMSVHAIKQFLKVKTTLEDDTSDERMTRLIESSKIPGVTLIKFLKLFTDTKEVILSKDMRDLLISYILVLTLIADEFESDPSDISKDLKMSIPTLKPHYLELGCKFSSAKKIISVTLPMPLTLPTMKPVQGKRR